MIPEPQTKKLIYLLFLKKSMFILMIRQFLLKFPKEVGFVYCFFCGGSRGISMLVFLNSLWLLSTKCQEMEFSLGLHQDVQCGLLDSVLSPGSLCV